jgi:hypothetical protein
MRTYAEFGGPASLCHVSCQGYAIYHLFYIKLGNVFLGWDGES